MDAQRWVEIGGYILQTYGIVVGGIGIVIDRVVGYSLLDALLKVVSRSLPADAFPLPRLFQGLAYSVGPRERSRDILNRPDVVIAYLAICATALLIFCLPALIPAGLIAGSSPMTTVGLVAISVALPVHIASSLAQAILISGVFRINADFWQKIQLIISDHRALFVRLFLLGWLKSAVTSLQLGGALLLIGLAHLPAWVFSRVTRVAVNLAHRKERDRYYKIIATVTLLVGTVLLFVSSTL